jgi:hypothetical protein
VSELRAKSLALRIKSAAGTPSDGQLAVIRAFTLRDFTAEELVVREYILAHNAIDRDKEAFAPSILDDFARTLPGKGAYIKHPQGWDGDSGPAEGRIFAARVERMGVDAAKSLLREPGLVFPPDQAEAVLLYASAYYVRTPGNTDFLLKLDAGIAGDVSIGFKAPSPERIKSPDGTELNAWRWAGPGEALEMSHVWLGAQPGARAVKHADRTPVSEEPMMDEAQIKALQGENTEIKAAAEAARKAAAQFEAASKALGDSAALLDDPTALAAAVCAGVAFHKSLVDDVIAAERHLGITGDSEDAVKASRELLESLPVQKLQALAKGLEARLPKGGNLKATDPNNRGGSDPLPDALDSAAL